MELGFSTFILSFISQATHLVHTGETDQPILVIGNGASMKTACIVLHDQL